MTRMDEIRSQLLEARGEAEKEKALIDRALAALGVQQEQSGQRADTPKKKRADHSNKPQLASRHLDKIVTILEEADHPLRTREVAEKLEIGHNSTAKGLGWLAEQGRVKKAGLAPGKGRIPLYVAVKKEPQLSEDLRPERTQSGKSLISNLDDESLRRDQASDYSRQ